MSIWDKVKAAKLPKKKESKIDNLPDDLKQEIMAMREKKKHFDAVFDCDTFVVLQFSCDADKTAFMKHLMLKTTEAYLDGYEFSTKYLKHPMKPSVKLPKPLSPDRYLEK